MNWHKNPHLAEDVAESYKHTDSEQTDITEMTQEVKILTRSQICKKFV